MHDFTNLPVTYHQLPRLEECLSNVLLYLTKTEYTYRFFKYFFGVFFHHLVIRKHNFFTAKAGYLDGRIFQIQPKTIGKGFYSVLPVF